MGLLHHLKKYARERDVVRLYNDIYWKWFNELLRYNLNLFTWKNIPCPQDVIETYLTFNGVCGLVNDAKEGKIIVKGSMTGVTNYESVFTTFVYVTPLTSGMFKIGKTGVICKANNLCAPDYDCIDNYANLLTHTDLTIQATLINMRATNAFASKNQAQADTIREWIRSIRKGKINVIMDKKNYESIVGDNGITTLPTYNQTHNTLSELYATRQNILRDYFTERGFVADKGKTERLVTDELTINGYRTIFGISDMYKERKEFCERANNLYKTDYQVDYNEYILKEIDDIMNGGKIYGTSENSGAVTENVE